MMKFSYQPLHVEKTETRLVTILAGTFEEEIQTTLKVVSLDDSPEYEALSYVWGDSSITKSIKLDGISFQVTKNLESALRHLRQSSKDRVFWIDAICINQQDIPERNTQVPLMDRIYGQCGSCIAWLGDEGDDTEDFMSFIHNFAQNKHLHQWPSFSHIVEVFRAKDIKPQNNAQLGDFWKEFFAQNPRAFQHLYTFMDRPWWHRVWTIQEFVLPKQLVFVSGHSLLSWDLLQGALRPMLKHLSTCCRACHIGMPRTLGEQMGEGAERLMRLDTLRNKALEGKDDLVPILLATRSKKSTDLRDQVYSLLGLLSMDAGYRIVPDYGKDIPIVYSEVVKYQIDTTKCLDVLAFMLDKNSDLKLPSWVPDWSCPQPDWATQGARLYMSKAYDACSDNQFDGQIFEDRILKLRGYHHSTVAASGVNITKGDVTLQFLSDWASALSDECVEDVLLGGIKMPVFQEQFLALLRDPPLTFTKAHMAINEVLLRTMVLLAERRFFTVDFHDAPGVGRHELKTGDEIWIVAGGKMPLILRPSDQTFRSPADNYIEHKCYTFIGDCYLYGVMKGEAAWKLKDSSIDIFLV